MKLHADHRTVFELQHGMLGRQVACFERAEDAAEYIRLNNEANREDVSQILQNYPSTQEQVASLLQANRHLGEQLAAMMREREAAMARVAELEQALGIEEGTK